jgi:hypothetical protein
MAWAAWISWVSFFFLLKNKGCRDWQECQPSASIDHQEEPQN